MSPAASATATTTALRVLLIGGGLDPPHPTLIREEPVNAAVESVWSPLQTNVLNQRRWRTRQELRPAIVV